MSDMSELSPTRRRIERLRERDGDLCQVCQLPMLFGYRYDHPREFHTILAMVDHIQPKSLGGILEPENTRLLHQWCNGSREHRPRLDTRASKNTAAFAIKILIPLVAFGLIDAKQATNVAPAPMQRWGSHLLRSTL